MRPFTVVLGIIMGSAVALAAGLGMSAVVFMVLWLLGDGRAQIAAETPAMLQGLAWTWSLSALSVAAFYGEVRTRHWRRAPQFLLPVALVLLGWRYWPT
jgi:hypothetical protein